MIGYRFEKYIPSQIKGKASFDDLLKLFNQLVTALSGDVAEALEWMNHLDKRYKLTDDSYGMGDFIEDLKQKGYIKETGQSGAFQITSKAEQSIRKQALEEIFGKLKKSGSGQHDTRKPGQGEEPDAVTRPYQYGDNLEHIEYSQSIRNAHLNHGLEQFKLTEQDIEIRETEFKTTTATVLMIDISHSMILYGEDRITPAKKVAMALSELIATKYPKDTLDVIVFGNDAWMIEKKDIPYLKVGPYHTNTVAGLELAMDLLRRRKNRNKQIFMITDGKPTCLKEGNRYYKNSFGLDRKILNRTLNLATQCKRLKIPITTFMIASDPYLQDFVREFTETNSGKAYYSTLDGLGKFIFEDYQRNRRKIV
jgi:uncharacterized protein with von Willebrand factor type A (vWA) domain